MTVVAVFALSPLMMTCTCAGPAGRTSRPKPSGITSTARARVQVQQPLGLRRRVDGGDQIEVAGVDERRHQRAALGRAVAVLDRERDVPDVEVQRVAVEQQEERRHEDQDRQRAAVAADLAQLLPVDRERLRSCGRLRAPSRRRRGTRPRATARPRRCSRPRRPAPRSRVAQLGRRRSASRSTACTAVPNRLVFSTSGIASSARIASTGSSARISTIGRPAKTCFTSAGVPMRRQAPGVNQRDAMAALRFVQVVRRDEDRDARLRERVDEPPELAARQRIDAAGRLVEEEDRRLVEDRAAEREPLPPAAGEIARERVLAALQPAISSTNAPPLARAARASSP